MYSCFIGIVERKMETTLVGYIGLGVSIRFVCRAIHNEDTLC